jgi:hypothetical protein
MLVLFVALTAVSLLALAGSVAWGFRGQGRVEARSGRDVGAEVMGAIGQDDDEPAEVQAEATLVERSAFRGQGRAVSAEVSYAPADLVAALRDGRPGQALPGLVAMGSFVCLLVFGGAALLVAVDEKVFGLIVLATGLYGAWLAVRGFVEAGRTHTSGEPAPAPEAHEPAPPA